MRYTCFDEVLVCSRQHATFGGFMGEFSPWHWLLVLAIVLLLFGPRRLPEIGKGIGDGLRALKKGMKEGTSAITDAKSETKPDSKPDPRSEDKG